MMKKIYYGKAVYNNKEINAVINVLKHESLSLIDGKKVKKLEKLVSKSFGKKYGLMVNSGSSANLLALSSFDFKKGSEVITPNLTFSTTVAPIYQLGLTPHFIGVEENKFIADPSHIEKCINKKTVALMIPNLLGNIADWKKINSIAKKYKLKVIEDAAESIGSFVGKKHTGTYGNIGIFSFNGNKTITTGGGGMVITNNKSLSDQIRSLSSTAKKKHAWNFDYDNIGFNYRLPNINAALGCVQIDRLKDIVSWKNEKISKEIKNYSNYLKLPDGMISGYYKFIVFDKINNSTGKVYDIGCHKIFKENVKLENTDWVNNNHWCVPIYYKG